MIVRFSFLTRNPICAHHYKLAFLTPSEIRVSYADFLTLGSILKGTIDMNQNS